MALQEQKKWVVTNRNNSTEYHFLKPLQLLAVKGKIENRQIMCQRRTSNEFYNSFISKYLHFLFYRQVSGGDFFSSHSNAKVDLQSAMVHPAMVYSNLLLRVTNRPISLL